MSAQPILSQSTVSSDGKWEGWCWYPDHPLERAVVEVFIGTQSIRAVRAARLRTDIRDLGMGDGYCGFQLPLPPKALLSGYSIVEVKERRFGRVIGRVVYGEDGSLKEKDLRLQSAARALTDINSDLDLLSMKLTQRGAPLEELGAILTRWSRYRRSARLDSLRMGALAVGQERMRAAPYVDLGWCKKPRVTFVLSVSKRRITRDTKAFVSELREAASALRQVGAEFILLDDGTEPQTILLPSRLRHLQVVSSIPGETRGVALNSAVLNARGTWLAFARSGEIAIAQMLEAVTGAVIGVAHIEAPPDDSRTTAQCHRLQALISRDALLELGGFDSQLEDPAVWADLSERATLVGQQVVRCKTPRDIALMRPASGEQQYA